MLQAPVCANFSRIVYNVKSLSISWWKVLKIQELSDNEKVILAQELWDSVIINQQALEMSQEQIDELNERLAQFELDEELGSSWSDVKKRILGN